MNTEKSKRKVLIVSLLVFLVCGGGVFTFFTFQGLEDLKGNPNLAFEYDSFPKKAVLPLLKYMGLVDTEVFGISNENAAIKEGDPFVVLKDETISSADSAAAPGAKAGVSSRKGAYSRPYYPSSKLSSNMSGAGAIGSGGAEIGFKSPEFSSSGGKGVSRGSSGELYKVGGDSKNVMARLKGTQAIMLASLRSSSADLARAKWDQGFAGSNSGKASGMFYGGGAVKLDKFDAKPDDLKLADISGLNAPDPGEPQEDKAAEEKDPLMQKAKEAIASVANDMARSMGQSMLGGLTGGGMGGGGDSESVEPMGQSVSPTGSNSKSIPSSQFGTPEMMDKVDRMTLPYDSNVTVYYTPATDSYTAIFIGKDEMGPYIDSYRVGRDGSASLISIEQ